MEKEENIYIHLTSYHFLLTLCGTQGFKNASQHIMSGRKEKNRKEKNCDAAPERTHDVFPPTEDAQSACKHVAFLHSFIKHESPNHPSIPLFSILPPSSLSPSALPGGRQQPWGRAALTCRNRPRSAATPGALLISTFQFLASVRPQREVIEGRWGRQGWAAQQKGLPTSRKLKCPRSVFKMLRWFSLAYRSCIC